MPRRSVSCDPIRVVALALPYADKADLVGSIAELTGLTEAVVREAMADALALALQRGWCQLGGRGLGAETGTKTGEKDGKGTERDPIGTETGTKTGENGGEEAVSGSSPPTTPPSSALDNYKYKSHSLGSGEGGTGGEANPLGGVLCAAPTSHGTACKAPATFPDGRCRYHTTVGGAELFDVFWAAYPRHVGKAAARRKFQELSTRHDAREIVAAAYAYARDCEREGREERYIAHPVTWLNQGRFEDPPQSEVDYRWALARLRGWIVPSVPFTGRRELLDDTDRLVLAALEDGRLEPPIEDVAAAGAELAAREEISYGAAGDRARGPPLA